MDKEFYDESELFEFSNVPIGLTLDEIKPGDEVIWVSLKDATPEKEAKILAINETSFDVELKLEKGWEKFMNKSLADTGLVPYKHNGKYNQYNYLRRK